MVTFGAFEAKTHFASLLERVERGEEITITRHGKPVARLVPIKGTNPDEIRATIRRLEEFSKGQTLGGISARSLIEEGRR